MGLVYLPTFTNKNPRNLGKYTRPIDPMAFVLHVISTRWAPTSYKWSYNPYKWAYNWVTGVKTLLIEVITPLVTSRGPPCTES